MPFFVFFLNKVTFHPFIRLFILRYHHVNKKHYKANYNRIRCEYSVCMYGYPPFLPLFLQRDGMQRVSPR